MRVESVPGMANVVRFPVERRARSMLELLWEIAPDVRRVLSLAEAFGLEAPATDLRDLVDADAAEHIANYAPPAGAARVAMLAEMLDPVIATAVRACREASDAADHVAAAQRAVESAQVRGFAPEFLEARSEAPARRMTELLVVAHTRVEEAAGVARAVGMARQGHAWTPRDVRLQMDGLQELSRAAGA